MDSISPSYYAERELNSEFVLIGDNFDGIPMNSVGLYSNNNTAPLQNKGTSGDSMLYDIVEKTRTRMRLVSRAPDTTHVANYLGGITSPDGRVIYWTNNTRPLP